MPLLGSRRSSDPGLLVRVSLLDGAKHGYAITKDIERLTGRRLGPGTLYGAISRLEGTGLIEGAPAEDRRRPYALTAAGRREAERELNELAMLAREGQRRLGGATA